MAPGSRATAVVRIRNTGSARGRLALSKFRTARRRGPRGGDLYARLRLEVVRIGERPRRVYLGPLASMPAKRLGVMRLRRQRSYRFTVTFPRRARAADNALQGASTSVGFRWRLTRCPRVRSC